ncbi:hypothetical protein EG359_20500 [Chryseobacterium joostei]|uniref:Uncharacterized protein n=1 Tax=Chryseobacterium joostei TaxID=112234 RepID=A0ABN5SJ88_9FLAO|nr:hypothetical protein EG359_20500 [Chryseobacterium joostei]
MWNNQASAIASSKTFEFTLSSQSSPFQPLFLSSTYQVKFLFQIEYIQYDKNTNFIFCLQID